MAHTPGPWKWLSNNCLVGPGHTEVLDAADNGAAYGMHTPLIEHHWDKETAEANRALIAAAPAMAEALLWFIQNDDTNEGDTPMPEHGGKTWNEINAYWIDGLRKAHAALAAAGIEVAS